MKTPIPPPDDWHIKIAHSRERGWTILIRKWGTAAFCITALSAATIAVAWMHLHG